MGIDVSRGADQDGQVEEWEESYRSFNPVHGVSDCHSVSCSVHISQLARWPSELSSLHLSDAGSEARRTGNVGSIDLRSPHGTTHYH